VRLASGPLLSGFAGPVSDPVLPQPDLIVILPQEIIGVEFRVRLRLFECLHFLLVLQLPLLLLKVFKPFGLLFAG
jgi:hypothetical protein